MHSLSLSHVTVVVDVVDALEVVVVLVDDVADVLVDEDVEVLLLDVDDDDVDVDDVVLELVVLVVQILHITGHISRVRSFSSCRSLSHWRGLKRIPQSTLSVSPVSWQVCGA